MADDRHYVHGDFYRIDDRTGFKVRAKRTRKEWTGLIVDQDRWEYRHPQDFVKGVIDDQNVPDPRPRQTDVFLGPLTTQIAFNAGQEFQLESGGVLLLENGKPLTYENVSAGATAIPVLSSTRILIGDTVQIMLDNNQLFTTKVTSVPTLTSFTIQNPLPYSASAGNIVYDISAEALPNIG